VDDLTEKACETDERREHIRQILSYLERSKHHLYRYAEGPGYLLAPTGWTRGVPCVHLCRQSCRPSKIDSTVFQRIAQRSATGLLIAVPYAFFRYANSFANDELPGKPRFPYRNA
jgi:hypothetical protein